MSDGRYADSAQARETDERYFPSKPPRRDFDPANFHEYDHDAADARRTEEHASLKCRIGVAIGQMETILGIGEG